MTAPRQPSSNDKLAVKTLDEFVFGQARHPVACGRGIVCGAGTVFPEINFTQRIEEMFRSPETDTFLPTEYGLTHAPRERA